ncbi:MAG: tRNA lysidine(34) synthetase TilS [Flavobacterium sp.]|nr:MAG: tRNA lysidine(34) synthetase TilS [Flavobacterium sp.]
MLSKLQKHLSENFNFLKEKRLLIAVSGGVDSMVLVHLLKGLDYDISLAHCNFNLRGKESNRDEKFISAYAAENNIKIYATHFDTVRFASDNKLSVQVAARQLRYIWFHQLLEENALDQILTAHHLDDSLETFLINFTRGTGLEGLTGIPQQNGNILRLMLPFTRLEIEEYARQNAIEWREDSSNASDKYLRNKLRHDIVPLLKSLNPSFMDSFQETVASLGQAQSLVQDASVLVYRQVVVELEGKKLFKIPELKRLPNYSAYLYQWLNPFGFTAWKDIHSLIDAQSGKQVLAPGYRLLKDREVLILEPLREKDDKIYSIEENSNSLTHPIPLKFEHVDNAIKPIEAGTIYVDFQKLKFPLFVRKWREGDYLCPAGMNGQKKKLSKYFKDEKFSLTDKEEAWLLCSDNNIVWVIGKRADERFRTTPGTTQILKIEVLK